MGVEEGVGGVNFLNRHLVCESDVDNQISESMLRRMYISLVRENVI